MPAASRAAITEAASAPSIQGAVRASRSVAAWGAVDDALRVALERPQGTLDVAAGHGVVGWGSNATSNSTRSPSFASTTAVAAASLAGSVTRHVAPSLGSGASTPP
jgi:hypothetical protein